MSAADPGRAVDRRECPIEACDWHHDRVALHDLANWLGVDDAALAEAGGDIALAVMLADAKFVEAMLREHFQTHSLEDWVLEVERLTEAGWTHV